MTSSNNTACETVASRCVSSSYYTYKLRLFSLPERASAATRMLMPILAC